jgi:hypothetical protein
VNLGQIEMRATEQRKRCPREPRLGHCIGENAVELAVVEPRIWSDFEASAERWSIGDGKQACCLFERLSSAPATGHDPQFHFGICEYSIQCGDQVPTMRAQPSRHTVRELTGSGVKPNSRSAAERRFPSGGIRNDADVDLPNRGIPADEVAGESCRSSNGTNSKSPRQIVAASTRDDEHRLLQSYQFGKKAVYGSVTAQNDKEILIAGARQVLRGMDDEWRRPQQSKVVVAGTRTDDGARDHRSTANKPLVGSSAGLELLQKKNPDSVNPGSR